MSVLTRDKCVGHGMVLLQKLKKGLITNILAVTNFGCHGKTHVLFPLGWGFWRIRGGGGFGI